MDNDINFNLYNYPILSIKTHHRMSLSFLIKIYNYKNVNKTPSHNELLLVHSTTRDIIHSVDSIAYI